MDRRTVVEFEIHKTRLVASSFKDCALFDRSEKHLKQNKNSEGQKKDKHVIWSQSSIIVKREPRSLCLN